MTPVTTVTPAAAVVPARVATPNSRVAASGTRAAATSSHAIASAGRVATPAVPSPRSRATDDEILGIVSPGQNAQRGDDQLALEFDSDDSSGDRRVSEDAGRNPKRAVDENAAAATETGDAAEPENLRAVLDANPELRAAWQDANAYRETFATPQAAREATALLADVNRMDALFFSRRPEDHAALARAIADLDPASFESLARAIGEFAQTNKSNVARVFRPEGLTSDAAAIRTTSNAHESPGPDANAMRAPGDANESLAADHFFVGARHAVPVAATSSQSSAKAPAAAKLSVAADDMRSPTSIAQTEFFHATNASAVEGVVAAIESQVERLLPEGIAKSARARVVGEIYRELDSNLRSNRQLASQMRDAFRSGSLDAEHQRAIVSLITSRARQALPGVAKRVLNEWTSTLVNANQERRTRQRTAERRVDIAGSSGAGNDGRRSMSPRDLDYSRLSDADILNL